MLAARVPSAELAGLPELHIEGLREDHARALLGSALPGPLDARVRDLVIAQAQGNPLALLELPRADAGRAGRWIRATRCGITVGPDREQLPAAAGRPAGSGPAAAAAVAADPFGDPVLLRRAAGRLGIPVHAVAPAVEAALVQFGARVRFRHPLVRSAAYRSVSA